MVFRLVRFSFRLLVVGLLIVACSPSTLTSPSKRATSPIPSPTSPISRVGSPVAPNPTLASPPTTVPSSLVPSPTPPASGSSSLTAPDWTFKVINAYPHDRTAFTEGLVVDGSALYEGTGLNGESELRRVDLESGQVLQSVPLDAQYFGEGVTTWKDQIIQLTWKSHVGFVYDKASF